MFSHVAITPMFVSDQDLALEFYCGTLGFEVRTDVDLGPMRWLTVALPSRPDHEVLLQKPGPPPIDARSAAQLLELTERGAGTWMVLATDDVRAVHADLVAKGVEITQEPTGQTYGTDMAVRDPFGNQIRITQLAEDAR